MLVECQATRTDDRIVRWDGKINGECLATDYPLREEVALSAWRYSGLSEPEDRDKDSRCAPTRALEGAARSSRAWRSAMPRLVYYKLSNDSIYITQ